MAISQVGKRSFRIVQLYTHNSTKQKTGFTKEVMLLIKFCLFFQLIQFLIAYSILAVRTYGHAYCYYLWRWVRYAVCKT